MGRRKELGQFAYDEWREMRQGPRWEDLSEIDRLNWMLLEKRLRENERNFCIPRTVAITSFFVGSGPALVWFLEWFSRA